MSSALSELSSVMAESDDLHSLVLVSDYRVSDPQRMWSEMAARHAGFARLGAHHVVVYTSTQEPSRVLVTIGVRHREPVARLMRSPLLREWFDIAGVDDIPMVFAGQLVDKIDIQPSAPAMPPGVVVAAFASVSDVAGVVASVHRALSRFGSAGVRKTWIYQALDDEREISILQEIDNATNAQQWVEHPDAAAEWMRRADSELYPSIFVGRLSNVMAIESRR